MHSYLFAAVLILASVSVDAKKKNKRNGCDPDAEKNFSECFKSYRVWSGGQSPANVSAMLLQGLRDNDVRLFENMCATLALVEACMQTTVLLCQRKDVTEWYKRHRTFHHVAVRYDRLCHDATLQPFWKTVLPQHNLNECAPAGGFLEKHLLQVTWPFWATVARFNWSNRTENTTKDLCSKYDNAVAAIDVALNEKDNQCNNVTKEAYSCALTFSVQGRIENLCPMKQCLSEFLPPKEPDNAMTRRYLVGAFGLSMLKQQGKKYPTICPVGGDVVFIANRFFKIKGTSTFINGKKGGASVITMLHMSFYDIANNSSTPVVEYHAEGHLPNTFTDGRTSVRLSTGSVLQTYITEMTNKHVMIKDIVSGLFVAFRVERGAFSFIVNSPGWLLQQTQGLVIEGCKGSQTGNSGVTRGKKSRKHSKRNRKSGKGRSKSGKGRKDRKGRNGGRKSRKSKGKHNRGNKISLR